MASGEMGREGHKDKGQQWNKDSFFFSVGKGTSTRMEADILPSLPI